MRQEKEAAEQHHRKSLDTDINLTLSEGSEGSEDHGRENMFALRKHLSCHEQTNCG